MFTIPEPKHTIRTKWILATTVFFILVSAFTLFKLYEAPSLIRVPVLKNNYSEVIHVYGTIQSNLKSSINSSTSGRIKVLKLYPGMKVNKGDKLALIENPELKRELVDKELSLEELKLEVLALIANNEEKTEQYKLDIELLKNKIKLYEKKVEASTELHSKGVISSFDFEFTKLELREAQIKLQLHNKKFTSSKASMEAKNKALEFSINKLKAQIALLSEDIANLEIKAGIDGVITKVGDELELGLLLKAGDSLGQISDVNSLFAELYVNSSDAPLLSLNQVVKLNVQNNLIDAVITNISQQVEKGTVRLDAKVISEYSFRPNTAVTGEVVLFEISDSNVLRISSLPDAKIDKLNFFSYRASELIPIELDIIRSNGEFYLLDNNLPNDVEIYVEH